MGDKRDAYKIWRGDLTKRDPLEDVIVHGGQHHKALT